MSAAAEKMDRLIQDLLTYSRLSRTAIELGPTSLDEVVTTALEELRDEIQRRHAQVEVMRPLPFVIAHRPVLAKSLLTY